MCSQRCALQEEGRKLYLHVSALVVRFAPFEVDKLLLQVTVKSLKGDVVHAEAKGLFLKVKT